jgi:carbamoyl-phosphate synthase large subunit
MKKNILFPNVGRRVELINSFREAAGKHNIELNIIGTDITPDAAGLYFCDKTYILDKKRNHELLLKFFDIAKSESIDSVICTIDPDVSFFSENIDILNNLSGCDFLLSSPDIVKISSDKKLSENFFITLGVNTPKVIKKPSLFPVFAKPSKGSGSFGAQVIKNKKELDYYLDEFSNYDPIFQECITGKEYTLDCFVDDKGGISVSIRERLKVRGGEVSISVVVLDKYLEDEAKKILRHSGFYGPVTLQVIKSSQDGLGYFIEINPRFGGGSILSIKAGLNTPETILTGISSKVEIQNELKMLRYDMSVFLKND